MPALEKELMLKQLLEVVEGSNYLFFAKFSGISVVDLNDLRRKLEKVVSRTIVVKNSLARVVLERINAKAATEFLDGSVLMTAGKDDPQVVSKILSDFAKDHESFELKGIFIDRQVFKNQFIKELAKLPSKRELLASVVGGIQAPISGFVLGLGQVVRSLVNALDQIQKKKSSS